MTPDAERSGAPGPLRLCFLLESYYPRVGGTPTQARLLGEDLAQRGHQVLVITRRWAAEHAREETLNGVTVRRVGPVGYGQFKKWGMLLTCLPALIARRDRYDVIYVAGLRVLGIAAVAVARCFGKKTVLRTVSCGEVSGEFFRSGLKRLRAGFLSLPFRLLLAARNRLLRRADAFVAISSVIAAELEANGIEAERVEWIPNSVDPALYRPASAAEKAERRRRLGLPADGTVLVYTGRLVAYKGLPLLVHAFKRLAREHEAVCLVLVGSGGNDIENCEAQLRGFAAAEGLAGRIVFTGDVHNVHDYLMAADQFVFPTENEAFGISLIEAMACGLPAVSTTVGGVRDIVEDGQNALVMAAGDGDQLFAAVDALIRDPDLAARLGQAARRTVLDRFAREIVTQKYLALFRRLADGK
ncbi:MAG: glycosyltransferase family 4 protein [Kiritimatiellae bacterium]|nr:glycosyltransferase family 4 protein [Kiritimatiellia bacterium]